VNGQDLTALRGESLRRARRDFQMVFQDPYQSLNPRMNVLRLLGEPLKIHAPQTPKPERLSRVREVLEEVGLLPPELFLHRFPHELSGGQRQRVAIARAVITKPTLLIADEPVSMLDVSVRAGILRVLLDLRSKMGMSQLFITHDLAVAKHVCDRIAVMHSGRIVEMGPARKILSMPSDDYTRKLMQAVPDLRQIIAEKSRQAA
jgi:ABC-type glutathione transport system ATPase component